MARAAGAAVSRHRAVASGLRQLAADRRRRLGRSSRLSLSRSCQGIGPRRRDPGRRLPRRLDRGRDDGALDRAVFPRRAGGAARHQAARPRGSRHRRHACGAAAEYLRCRRAAPGRSDYAALPDGEVTAIVRGREAFALYGWKPYMHNPRLRRWLHRIDRPTLLLWGAQDGIVTPAYGEGWRREIPGAKIEIIPDAGHFPHWEQPEAFVSRLVAFADGARLWSIAMRLVLRDGLSPGLGGGPKRGSLRSCAERQLRLRSPGTALNRYLDELRCAKLGSTSRSTSTTAPRRV